MADLEDIDRCQQPASQERLLDGPLGVTGEQRLEAAVAEEHDDGAVVDVTFRKRRRRIGIVGVEHLERGRSVEPDRLPGPGDRESDPGVPRRIGQQPLVGLVREADAGVQHGPDAEPLDHIHQPRDVVLVRVADDHEVDAPLEERQVRPEPAQRELRIRPAVDQRSGAARRLDEDRVSLSDVQHGEVQPPVGERPQRDRREQRDERRTERDGPEAAAGG